MSSLIRSTVLVAVYTLSSRVLGYVRDILMASILGVGPVANAFHVAFRLTNVFRALFAEGAFSAAFIPSFSAKLAKDGSAEARIFASKVFTLLLLILVVFCTLIILLMPWLMHLLAHGFAEDKERFNYAVLFAQISFPYLLFISLVALLGGMLNSIGKFGAAAACPIILNLSMIIAMVGCTKYTSTPGHALAISVLVAGILQLIVIVLACLRAGIMVEFMWAHKDPQILQLLRTMLPAILGSGITQINLLINTSLATLIPQAVSILYYADRLSQLPLALIGTAIGTTLLPLLSKQVSKGTYEEAIQTKNRALEAALLLSLPCSAALGMLAHPIIDVLFKRGVFTADDVYASALALQALSLGIPAFILLKVLTPCFFAEHDTKTPFKVAVSCLAVNIILNLALMHSLTYVAFALSPSLSGWLNVVVLWYILQRKKLLMLDARIIRKLPRMLGATLGMCLVLYGTEVILQPLLLSTKNTLRFGGLILLIAGGSITYISFTLLFKSMTLEELKLLFAKRKKIA